MKLKTYAVPATIVAVGVRVSVPVLVHAAVLPNTVVLAPEIGRDCVVGVVVPERPVRTTLVLTTLPPVKQVVYTGRALVKVTVKRLVAHGLAVA